MPKSDTITKLSKALEALLYEVDASGYGTCRDYGWFAATNAAREAIAEARAATEQPYAFSPFEVEQHVQADRAMATIHSPC